MAFNNWNVIMSGLFANISVKFLKFDKHMGVFYKFVMEILQGEGLVNYIATNIRI